MKKEYKTPTMEKVILSVCDVITASTAVDTPDGQNGVYEQTADFFSWFGETGN